MRVEKASETEILVALDLSDQEAYGLFYENLSFSDLAIRSFCEQIALILCLRKDVPDDGPMTVRAVKNCKGELLLYFSFSENSSVGETCSGVVEFSSVDELLDCRRVFLLYSDLCAEIYSYGKKYYLWYEFYATADRSAQLTFALLEYGVSSPYDRTFLSEHGTLLPRALPLFL